MRATLPFLVLAVLLGCPATTPTPELPPTDPEPDESSELPSYLSPDFEDISNVVAREGEPSAVAQPIFANTRGVVLDVQFSPDGERLAFSTSDKVIGIIDTATGQLRAYRRVRVRADESIRLVGFDGTATRLLFLTFGYSESNVYAWDLWTNRFRVIEQEQVEGFGTVAFAGESLVHSGYESNTVRIITPDAETRQVQLDREVQEIVSASDRRTVLLETNESVVLLDTQTSSIIANIEGSVGAVRPGGGLIVINQEEGSRLVDERGETVALLRNTSASFTARGELILDRENSEGDKVRQIINPRTREQIAEFTLQTDSSRHQDYGRTSYSIEEQGRLVVRHDLATGDSTNLFVGWDIEDEFEDDDAVETVENMLERATDQGVVRGFQLSPDQTLLAIAFGPAVRIIDIASREERARYTNESGESSVWRVDDLDDGVGVWGRGWSQLWGSNGFHQIRCADSESGARLIRNIPAANSNYRACYGDREIEPEAAGDNLILGTDGERFAERAGNQILLRDFTNGRTRARYRLPDNLEVYCEGGGCSSIYHPATNRSAWLLDNLVSTAYLISSGRPRELGEAGWGTRPVGNRLFAVTEEGAKLYDTRGRTVSTLVGDQVAIDSDGTQWVSKQGDELVVQDVASGSERARLPSPEEVGVIQLFGDAILTRSPQTLTLHNTRGAAAIQFPSRTPISVFPDGSHFVVCDSGSLSLRRIEGQVRRELGDCGLGEQIFLIDPETDASGEISGYAALDSVTVVDVFNLAGGPPLTIRTNGGVPVAYSDGKFWTPDEHRSAVRWRAAGSLLSAEVGPAEAHYDATLLSRFFR